VNTQKSTHLNPNLRHKSRSLPVFKTSWWKNFCDSTNRQPGKCRNPAKDKSFIAMGGVCSHQLYTYAVSTASRVALHAALAIK